MSTLSESEIAFDQFFERMLNDYRIPIAFGGDDPMQQLREQARMIWNAAWSECEKEMEKK